MSKRKASEPLNESEISRGTKSRRLGDGNSISYPDLTHSHAKAPTPFQKPMPIISFSYTPSRTLEFNDLALRYFVDPPIGAQLSYGYDNWIRRPEEKGRIDGLLKALSRVKSNGKVALDDVAVVSWRGVMTRYIASRPPSPSYRLISFSRILTAPYEDRDGWELNVMCINGTMYFEEHISNQKLSEKSVAFFISNTTVNQSISGKIWNPDIESSLILVMPLSHTGHRRPPAGLPRNQVPKIRQGGEETWIPTCNGVALCGPSLAITDSLLEAKWIAFEVLASPNFPCFNSSLCHRQIHWNN
ncbi:uncharacterized protein ARMOST_13211 [Armillaria ostoyae]|uniref:Decapping nuclease n=1 Tax=Armillaria ostoyae TaxID=47428 RepID=A0A284RM44_ARMOS|nr:uncharacterized protein ARMOST_13211 [Armillaria ostoyae]